jgi:hypothetical protein
VERRYRFNTLAQLKGLLDKYGVDYARAEVP